MFDKEQLIDAYLMGFRNGLMGSSTVAFNNPVEDKAYEIGEIHAEKDRELGYVNPIPEKEILELITK